MKGRCFHIISLFTVAILTTLQLKAQNFEWVKSYGGYADEVINKICTDADGNIYVTGYYTADTDVDPGPDVVTIDFVESWDFYVAKYDSLGEFIWVKSWSDIGMQNSYDIAIDSAGRLIIAAYFSSQIDIDPGPGVTLITGHESYNTGLLLCLNLDGELIWWRADSDYGAALTTVNLDADNNIYVSGSLINTLDVDPGPGVFMLGATSDVCIRKFDSDGNFIWAKKFNDDDIEAIGDIVIDADDNIYIFGSFTGTMDFDPGPLTYEYTAAGGEDAFLTKWDASGNMIWYTTIGGPSDDFSRGMVLGNDGALYLAGRYQESCDFDGSVATDIFTAVGYYDAYLAKYSTDGIYEWVWAFGGSGNEFWNNVITDNEGYVYLFGNFRGIVDFDPGPADLIYNSFSHDGGYLVKLNSEKTMVWAVVYTTGHYVGMKSASIDNNNNAIYSGTFSTSVDFDPGPDTVNANYIGGYPSYYSDAYICKLNQDLCANLSINFDSIADISCLGPGYGLVHASGGAAPYAYSWDLIPPVTDSEIVFINDGIYTITATDTNACVKEKTFLIDGPGTLETDWSVSVAMEDFVYGFDSWIWIDAFNNGCSSSPATLQLILDPQLIYDFADPIPDYISGDTIQWNLSPAIYGDEHFKPMVKIIPDFGVPFTCSLVRLIDVPDDVDTTNNLMNFCRPIVGAFDPNDKSVYPDGACDAGYILNDQLLTYTIRFQNTGTSEAVNIYIIDSLSDALDISTLNVVAKSHDMVTELEGDTVIQFIFPDIYLPDSTADEVGSHGYVTYSIRPKAGLPLYTQIENNAGIYFDFNDPVITNTVSNTVIDIIPNESQALSFQMCEGDSLVVGDHTYFTPGTYVENLFTIDGCDSVVTTTISYIIVDTEIITGPTSLTASQNDATYQWLNCDAGWAAIPDATNQNYTPAATGNYAVVVSYSGCTDTSSCVSFVWEGLHNQSSSNDIHLTPNPAINEISLNTKNIKVLSWNMRNTEGGIIKSSTINVNTNYSIDISEINPGFYFIEVNTESGKYYLSFIKI